MSSTMAVYRLRSALMLLITIPKDSLKMGKILPFVLHSFSGQQTTNLLM